MLQIALQYCCIFGQPMRWCEFCLYRKMVRITVSEKDSLHLQGWVCLFFCTFLKKYMNFFYIPRKYDFLSAMNYQMDCLSVSDPSSCPLVLTLNVCTCSYVHTHAHKHVLKLQLGTAAFCGTGRNPRGKGVCFKFAVVEVRTSMRTGKFSVKCPTVLKLLVSRRYKTLPRCLHIPIQLRTY